MGQKEYTVSIEEVEEIVHRKRFEHRELFCNGETILKETRVDDEYVIIFDYDFPVSSIKCKEEPIVELEDGVVRIVSSELDKALSVLDSKVYKK